MHSPNTVCVCVCRKWVKRVAGEDRVHTAVMLEVRQRGRRNTTREKIELSYLVTTFITPAPLVMFTHTDGWTHCPPTLLSELGIMASVIQEPKRDPEALTVIGVLTAVRRPQPVNKRKEQKQHCVLGFKHSFWFGVSDVVCQGHVDSLFMCSHCLSQVLTQFELWKRCIASPQDENVDMTGSLK